MTYDDLPDYDQHVCVACGDLCDCGAQLDVPYDARPERCLSCTDCDDSLRAALVEAQANAQLVALQLDVDF